LTTAIGDIDLLGEMTGGGSYDDRLPHRERMHFFGCSWSCLDLPTLIRVERAAERPSIACGGLRSGWDPVGLVPPATA